MTNCSASSANKVDIVMAFGFQPTVCSEILAIEHQKRWICFEYFTCKIEIPNYNTFTMELGDSAWCCCVVPVDKFKDFHLQQNSTNSCQQVSKLL